MFEKPHAAFARTLCRLGKQALVLTTLAVACEGAFAQTVDPVVLTFSTVGDSRQDPATFDPTVAPLSAQDAIWLQNTKAWQRIIRTVQTQKPSLLFFNGDMIHGYGRAAAPVAPVTGNTVVSVVGSDLVKYYQQSAYWRGMVTPLQETGTYVVPVAGNHETQSKPLGKKAQVENEDAWGANFGDLVLDNTRFQNMFAQQPTNESFNTGGSTAAPDADGLTTNQSKLSYSFDFKGTHFVVINTDPVGKDGHAPTNWLAADLAAAQARGNSHFMVFGHKPAYTYNYLSNSGASLAAAGLDAVDVAARDAFWAVIELYGATYFCGHEHVFNIQQPGGPGKAYQVLVGAGGSPFDAKITDAINSPTDRTYSWATVKVHQSGAVDVLAYGFSDAFGPTQLLQQITLPH